MTSVRKGLSMHFYRRFITIVAAFMYLTGVKQVLVSLAREN
jgi:hypothetical protein